THRRGQPPERTKREQVFHGFAGLVLTKQERPCPGRQFALAPEGVIRPVFREDSEAGPAQSVGVRGAFAVGRMQQPAEEANAEFRGRLDTRGREETLPERLAGPLLAVAEERPANAALVVLCAR